MSELKTYTHVNRTDEKALFGISRMEDIYEKRGGAADEPHRHDFFTVLFTKAEEDNTQHNPKSRKSTEELFESL